MLTVFEWLRFAGEASGGDRAGYFAAAAPLPLEVGGAASFKVKRT